ncbi:MAG TPA: NADH-quinone oxidoreductase subunit M [Candidatus Limnocylindrales bacterium]|nr:NADH-quinone oxidoreductase subunit M [Candidatus Limnocylindrales bacterium]
MISVLSLLTAAASPSPAASPVPTASPIPSGSVSAIPTLIPSTPIPTTAPLIPALASPQLPALLLSGMVWVPVIVGAILLLVPQRTEAERARVRLFAIIASGFVLVLAVLTWYGFADQGGSFAFEEQRSWLPALGSSYHLGIDGISLALLVLSSLLSFCAVLASTRVRERPGLYFALLLLMETGLNGAFASLDGLLLALFWAMPIVSIFLLIAGWGGAGRKRAAWKALAFGLCSTGLLTLALLITAARATPSTLDLVTLHQAALRGPVVGLVFWLSLAAFAILLPLVPVHTWFADAVAEAPPAVGAMIGGALPALGGYGLYRVIAGEFAGTLHHVRGAILVLTLISLLWGGISALGQDDLARAIAHLAMSRSALVLLAVASASPVALNGGVLLMVASGMGTALLLLVTGMVAERTGTRSLRALAGLSGRLPRAAVLYLIGGLALTGVPGLAGFAGMLLVFLGAYPVERTATTIAILGSLLITGLVIWTAERIFFGSIGDAHLRLRDLGTLELTCGTILAAMLILLGIFPGLLVSNVNFGILNLLAGATG